MYVEKETKKSKKRFNKERIEETKRQTNNKQTGERERDEIKTPIRKDDKESKAARGK